MPRIVLLPTGQTLPSDDVHFTVAVDTSRCVPAPALQPVLDGLATNGLSVSIAQIVTYAGKQYYGAAADPWDAGPQRAEIALAWANLAAWNPQAVAPKGSTRKRLVLANLKNSRQRAHISEALATGVGLIVAAKVYSLPYKFWYPVDGLGATDFAAPDATGSIRVEVRGRFGRAGWNQAIGQIYKKFGATPSLVSRLGDIFAPRSTTEARKEDICLIDPEGPPDVPRDNAASRALLRHYAPFFAHQGYAAFAARLREIADLSRDDFILFLDGGDDVLRAAGRVYRTSFLIGVNRFLGTAWGASAVPLFQRDAGGAPLPGYVIWGIWEVVLVAIVEGRLLDIAEGEFGEWSMQGEDAVYAVQSDGTAAAWAPTLDALLKMP